MPYDAEKILFNNFFAMATIEPLKSRQKLLDQ